MSLNCWQSNFARIHFGGLAFFLIPLGVIIRFVVTPCMISLLRKSGGSEKSCWFSQQLFQRLFSEPPLFLKREIMHGVTINLICLFTTQILKSYPFRYFGDFKTKILKIIISCLITCFYIVLFQHQKVKKGHGLKMRSRQCIH